VSDKEHIKEIVLERNPDAIFLEEKFDDALIGTSIQCGSKHVATYDSNKCIEILTEQAGMDEMEAYEHFNFATEQIDTKENAPIIFSDFRNAKRPDLPRDLDGLSIADLI
jgi:hypothetical protein